MDPTINAAIQKALDLLKAGNKTGAYTILVSILEENSEVPEAWYLLAFTITDTEQKLDCFRQVLRLDPTNQAAQKQIEKLTVPPPPPPPPPPKVDAFHPESLDDAPAPPVRASTRTQLEPESAPWASVPAPVFDEPAAAQTTSTTAQGPAPIPWLVIGIAALVLLILIGLPLIYIANGMETNRRVNALFTERKCAEVVGYKSFTQSYPSTLFLSLYSVYDQVGECQAKLDLDYYHSKQDWPLTYNVIQHYLSDYPNGAFASEMRALGGEVLTTWANALATQKDYKTAIERLELIGRAYPDSPAAPAAQTAIFNNYLLWGKDRFDQKDYKGAEETLKKVNGNENASPDQVKQANLGLASVYLQWGKADILAGKLDLGLQRYDAAQALAPDLANYAQLKNEAGLLRVDVLITEGDFNKALELVTAQLEAATLDQEKADLLAKQAQVYDAYSKSDGKQAQTLMNDTSISMCSEQPPALPIFGTDPSISRFAFVSHLNIQVPDGWGAFKPSELHYTVCIEHSSKKIQTCGPYLGDHFAYRIQYSWDVKVYDMTTGKLFKNVSFAGVPPRACRYREFFVSGSSFVEIAGLMPQIEKVLDWLTSLRIHQ